MITKKFLSPKEVLDELPASKELLTAISAHRTAIENILSRKDKRHLIIVGPCSIHDEQQAIHYAKKLKYLQEKVKEKYLLIMRTYFEKPRSTLGWKGWLTDPDLSGEDDMEQGIKKARKLLIQINQLGVPCATETLNPLVPNYLADLISYTCIGARTAESQTHREIASGLQMPIGFKNSTDGNLEIALNAMQSASGKHTFLGISHEGHISTIQSQGNAHCHLIMRGGKEPNFDEESIAHAIKSFHEVNIPPKIIVDCSHGNSGKDRTKQAAVFKSITEQMKTNDAIRGLMLESNLKAGKQNISDDLEEGISITDACIGWDETQELICSVINDDN